MKRLLLVLLLCLLGVAPVLGAEQQRRLQFPRGQSSATISGGVVLGDRDVWLVGAAKGQRMVVRITSPENNAVFQIDPPGPGAFLKGAGEMDDATSWKGTLPASGDYRVIVGGTRGNASYRLTVEIR